jgi:hypothetical protein
LSEARAEAVQSARELMAARMAADGDACFEIADDSGKTVLLMPFKEAIEQADREGISRRERTDGPHPSAKPPCGTRMLTNSTASQELNGLSSFSRERDGVSQRDTAGLRAQQRARKFGFPGRSLQAVWHSCLKTCRSRNEVRKGALGRATCNATVRARISGNIKCDFLNVRIATTPSISTTPFV